MPVAAPKDHFFYMNNTDPLAFRQPPLAAFIDDRDQRTLRSARFRQIPVEHGEDGRARRRGCIARRPPGARFEARLFERHGQPPRQLGEVFGKPAERHALFVRLPGELPVGHTLEHAPCEPHLAIEFR